MPSASLPPVVYEDESMLAFDKPAGLPVAPDRQDQNNRDQNNPPATLMRLVHARYGREVTNVHRLDADASGVLLCARDKPALDALSGQFQSKTATRVCHALVVVMPPDEAAKVGAVMRDARGLLPDEFAVELTPGADEARPGRMRIFRKRGGKACITRFRTLERFGRFALVECRPLAGRPHQIRAHLAAIGAPVLNDALYGVPEVFLKLSDLKRGYKGRADEKPLIARLALHASSLTVRHPVTRAPVTMEAPLPGEFTIALRNLRKYRPRR
ncbi:MAG: RluA family pseudouridine synthase [Opitutaceae bacterium]|jgi:RluA family pseudouridine synthase|nr:RluA family pseudouridine synthase [Opitutaceae bacterium]